MKAVAVLLLLVLVGCAAPRSPAPVDYFADLAPKPSPAEQFWTQVVRAYATAPRRIYQPPAAPARVQSLPGMPLYNQFGQPGEFRPVDGGGGAALGPVTPNAYGLGVGMDASGRPVQFVPW